MDVVVIVKEVGVVTDLAGTSIQGLLLLLLWLRLERVLVHRLERILVHWLERILIHWWLERVLVHRLE